MSEVKGIEISDVLGLSQPLTKLIETVSGGIGKIYEPTHIKRIAKAKTEEIKLISSAVSDNISFPIAYTNGQVAVNSEDFEGLRQRAQQRFLFQEMTKQNNIDAVVLKAYKELEQEDDVSEIPVDLDWTNRFFDSVANVSNEDIQLIWGKILAGEIKRPGSFSLRTLETIRNMSIKEAETFQKVMPYIMTYKKYSAFIINDSDILEKNGIKYEDILLLDEAGLINSRDLVVNCNVIGEKTSVSYNKNFIIMLLPINNYNGTYKIYNYAITKAGYELYDLLCNDTDINYVKDIAKKIHKENIGKFELAIYKVEKLSDDMISFEEEPIETYN